jgi:hypothetical protein
LKRKREALCNKLSRSSQRGGRACDSHGDATRVEGSDDKRERVREDQAAGDLGWSEREREREREIERQRHERETRERDMRERDMRERERERASERTGMHLGSEL